MKRRYFEGIVEIRWTCVQTDNWWVLVLKFQKETNDGEHRVLRTTSSSVVMGSTLWELQIFRVIVSLAYRVNVNQLSLMDKSEFFSQSLVRFIKTVLHCFIKLWPHLAVSSVYFRLSFPTRWNPLNQLAKLAIASWVQTSFDNKNLTGSSGQWLRVQKCINRN